jgi:beta-mannosidase
MFSNNTSGSLHATELGHHAAPWRCTSILQICTVTIALSGLPLVDALHHMSNKAPRRVERRKEPVTPLLVTNYCPETIWPGISTQSGDGPKDNGFELKTGKTRNQTVSEDWQGRVWGRTNCSFNAEGTGPKSGSGRACRSGDCNGILNCQVGVSDGILAGAHLRL